MQRKMMGRLEMHGDTRLLIAYLTERFVKEKADFSAYRDLSAAIGGRDVQKEARSLLASARRHLVHEHGILLVAVPKEGLRRERDVGEYLAGTKKHIGRVARRKLGHAAAALEGDGVTNEERIKACMEASLLGAILRFTEPKARKLIEGKIEASAPKELPTAETIRAQFEK